MTDRPRARDLGLVLGGLPPGPLNAITDVEGVQVGHVTRIEGKGKLAPGHGPVRTGVTAIVPHAGDLYRAKVAAGVHAFNGLGKSCGLEQVRELGEIETPILLTNTLSAWRAADALVTAMLHASPDIGITTGAVNPVVCEVNDGYLNDLQGRHIREQDVLEALENAAPGPLEEGSVGGGTGCVAFGFKAGIGTASRRVPESDGGFTVGALVQANFGRPEELIVGGARLGRALRGLGADRREQGSVVVVLATDAPCDGRQLARLARRGVLGLARTGATGAPGSGDYVVAFSTTHLRPHDVEGRVVAARPALLGEQRALGPLFQAAVEAVEEAVVNSLLRAEAMIGRDDRRVPALPLEPLRQMLGLV